MWPAPFTTGRFAALALALALSFAALAGCASTCSILSEPAGAEVYVDGEYKGKTPVDVEMPFLGNDSGPIFYHRIVVTKDGSTAEIDVARSGAARTWPERIRLAVPPRRDARP